MSLSVPAVSDRSKLRRGAWHCENCDFFPASHAGALRSHDLRLRASVDQVSQANKKPVGITSRGEGSPVIMLSSFPGSKRLVGVRLPALSPGDQFQASHIHVRSQDSLWQRHVCLRPSDGPGVTGP